MKKYQVRIWLYMVLFAFAFSLSFSLTQQAVADEEPNCCQYQHPCGVATGHWVQVHGGGVICTGCESPLFSCEACPNCP